MDKYYSLGLLIILLFSTCQLKLENKADETQSGTDNNLMKEYSSDTLKLSISYPSDWETRTQNANVRNIGFFEPLQDSSDNYEENLVIWTEILPIAISDSLYAKAASAQIRITNPTLEIKDMPSRKIGPHLFYPYQFNFTTKDSTRYTVCGYTTLKGKIGYNFTATATAASSKSIIQTFETILASFKPRP